MSETLKKVFISVIVLVLIGAAVYFIYDTLKASPKKANALTANPNRVVDTDKWNFSTRYPSSYQGSLSLMNKVYDNTMRFRSLADPDNPESFYAWGSNSCDGSLRDEVYNHLEELVHTSYLSANITEDMIHCAVNFIVSTKYWLIFSQLEKDDQLSILDGIFNQYCKPASPPVPKQGESPTLDDVTKLVNTVANGKYKKDVVDCAITFFMKPVIGKDSNGNVVNPAISWLSFKRLNRGDQIKFLDGVVSEHCATGCANGKC